MNDFTWLCAVCRAYDAALFHLFDKAGCAVLPSLYANNVNNLNAFDLTTVSDIAATGIRANPVPQGVVSILALAINVVVLTMIIKRSVQAKKNPYTNEIWTGTKDFEEAMARAE